MIPLGIRSNNPGNLEPGGWQGEMGRADGGRFARFNTMRNGIRALSKQLLVYYDRHKALNGSRIDTVDEAVSRWAPPNENNTEAYIAMVCTVCEVNRDDRLDFHDPTGNTLWWLARAIMYQENGYHAVEAGVSDADMDAGIAAALA
jgi:hypothetical protein